MLLLLSIVTASNLDLEYKHGILLLFWKTLLNVPKNLPINLSLSNVL